MQEIRQVALFRVDDSFARRTRIGPAQPNERLANEAVPFLEAAIFRDVGQVRLGDAARVDNRQRRDRQFAAVCLNAFSARPKK